MIEPNGRVAQIRSTRIEGERPEPGRGIPGSLSSLALRCFPLAGLRWPRGASPRGIFFAHARQGYFFGRHVSSLAAHNF